MFSQFVSIAKSTFQKAIYMSRCIVYVLQSSRNGNTKKEWRLFSIDKPFLNYDPDSLTAVYFGFRVEEEFIHEIDEAQSILKV